MLEELELGIHHQIRSKILKLPKSLNFDYIDSYYKLIQNPPALQLKIIEVIDQKARLRSTEMEYWDKYWKKIIKYLDINLMDEISINVKVKSKDVEGFEYSINKYIEYQLKHKSKTGIFDIPNDGFYAKNDRQDISKNQNKDYSKCKYKCYDKIDIPGERPMQDNCRVIINGKDTFVDEANFKLLLRLVVQIKNGKNEGWVNMPDIKEETPFTTVHDYHNYIHRLRKDLKHNLINQNHLGFIENNSSGD